MAYSYRIESPSGKAEDNTRLARLIKQEAFRNHLILQTAGVQVDRMKMSPSFCITESEINTVMKRLQEVLGNIG